MTSMAYSTISLLTNNPIMIKENANYYKSLNDDISDSYNTITMKKMDYGMTLSIVKIFLWLTTTPRSLKAGQLPMESAACRQFQTISRFKTRPILSRICYKRKGPRTKKLIFLVYKCATVINAVLSSLSPFTSRENGVVLHKSGSNFPLVCSFK